MKPFDIREHIEFDGKGRAQCPSCLQDGKTGKNLSVMESGAYKCFRSCTTDQIREAIGVKRDTTLPPPSSPPAPPPKGVLNSPQKVKAATDRLLNSSTHALKWLSDRGITSAMIEHYRLGVVRARVGDSTKPNKFTHLPAVAIAIPNHDGTQYFHKKRVRPWLPKAQQPDGYQAWSQYGIPAMAYHTHKPTTAKQTWLCEGEWDAIVLGWAVRHSELKNDIQVSCFTCGAGNFSQECRRELAGEIITFYDRDEAGTKGATKFQGKYPKITRVATVPAPQDAPKGWDVSDTINAGIGLEQFVKAASEAIVYEEPKKPNPLRDRIVTNDELLATAPDYTDWLVDDILTADELFLLAAGPRTGKSLMALTLAKAVATGGKFLGRPCSKGAVIYIRCEDSDSKTKEREIKQGWGEGLPVYWLDKFKLDQLPHLRELIEELDARLIVFDTLSRVKDAAVSESSAEMSQLLEPVQEMCKDLRCTGLLVHHMKKVTADQSGDIDIFEGIRGSSSIRATCRGSLVIAAGDNCYRLGVENGWCKLDLQILLDANTLNWKLLGNWAGPNVDLSQKDRVLNFLRQVGSAQLTDIAEATNLPKRSLYEVLKRLQSDDMVIKNGHQRSAIYTCTQVQQVQQLNSLLNCPNTDPETNRPPVQQEKNTSLFSKKVITEGKSDQKNDHFLSSTPTPQSKETVDKKAESYTGQPIASSTEVQHSSTAPQKVINSLPERWMIHTEYDTVVEVTKPGKKTSEVKILGVGLRRVDNTLLEPCDYEPEQ